MSLWDATAGRATPTPSLWARPMPTWPTIVADAARGALREVYTPVDAFGQEVKPSLADYPEIPWDRMDLDQFNMIRHFPKLARTLCYGSGHDLAELSYDSH